MTGQLATERVLNAIRFPAVMKPQGLERTVEYMHYRNVTILEGDETDNHEPQVTVVDGIYVGGERTVSLGTTRVVYFWNLPRDGDYYHSIEVPGILVREKYREDVFGIQYSRVKPVPKELRPSLERTIWLDMIMRFGSAASIPDTTRFAYWPESVSVKLVPVS